MTKKKILVLLGIALFVSVGVFIIYKRTYKEEFNYVVLGDSLSAGRNPYGTDDYGYTDYVRDYLKKENKLGSYLSYAVSGYAIDDVKNDINLNRSIIINNKNQNIRKVLREADIVTITIGANDLLKGINISSVPQLASNKASLVQKIDDIMIKLDALFELIKRYAKGKIIVVGYYNPLPHLEKYKNDIDEIVAYVDEKYESLCSKYSIYYVKTSEAISKNNDYLPNPLDIHLSKEGYKTIGKSVISLINKEIFK